jgi:hypothetical protein
LLYSVSLCGIGYSVRLFLQYEEEQGPYVWDSDEILSRYLLLPEHTESNTDANEDGKEDDVVGKACLLDGCTEGVGATGNAAATAAASAASRCHVVGLDGLEGVMSKGFVVETVHYVNEDILQARCRVESAVAQIYVFW